MTDQEPTVYDKYYKEIHASLADASMENEKAFNNKVLYIAAGAVVLLVTFCESVIDINNICRVWLLHSAWALLTASIVMNVLSYRVSSILSNKCIREIHDSQKEAPFTGLVTNIDDRYRKVLKWNNILNNATAIVFLIGIISAVIFVFINI